MRGGRARGRCRIPRPKWIPGRASPWPASLPRHSDSARDTVGLRGKPQVDGEGLERSQLQESAKEEESWNEPFLHSWRR